MACGATMSMKQYAVQLLDYPERGQISWCGGNAWIPPGGALYGRVGLPPRLFNDLNQAQAYREDIQTSPEVNKSRTYQVVEYPCP